MYMRRIVVIREDTTLKPLSLNISATISPPLLYIQLWQAPLTGCCEQRMLSFQGPVYIATTIELLGSRPEVEGGSESNSIRDAVRHNLEKPDKTYACSVGFKHRREIEVDRACNILCIS